jgi:hypothetical protein
MICVGGIINPIGCAVAYRRKYLKKILDEYTLKLGNNLTSSEDIFIGFAFNNVGYRNIQVQSIYALTREPRIAHFPKQVMMWSSAFLQSCYYFNSLVMTPFKAPRLFYQKIKEREDSKLQARVDERKIREGYRQNFSVAYTEKYGRPIGWFIFTALFEKISFPTIIIILICLQLWKILAITFIAELSIYTLVVALLRKHYRIKNVLKSILFSPVRYSILLFDIFVIANFVKDIWITQNRNWIK